ALMGGGMLFTPEVQSMLRRKGFAFRIGAAGSREIGAISVDADGRFILTGCQGSCGIGSEPGRLYLWEAATGRCVRTFGEHQGLRIADLSPDARVALPASGSSRVAASDDPSVSAEKRARAAATGLYGRADELSFSLWDVQGGRLISRWDWGPGWIWSALDLDA